VVTAPKSSAIKMSSNDPTQHVEKLSPSQFKISGVGSNRGTKASVLTVTVGGKTIRVPIGGGQNPGQTAALLQKSLPPTHEMEFRLTHRHLSSDVIIDIRKKPAASKIPNVTVQSNDPGQRLTSLARNKFEISGIATNNGIIQSFVNVAVDGKSAKVFLNGGETTEETAKKIAAALPKGYKATVERKPIPPYARVDLRAWPVTVTITRTKT
jgi:phage tail sheath gpL-like